MSDLPNIERVQRALKEVEGRLETLSNSKEKHQASFEKLKKLIDQYNDDRFEYLRTHFAEGHPGWCTYTDDTWNSKEHHEANPALLKIIRLSGTYFVSGKEYSGDRWEGVDLVYRACPDCVNKALWRVNERSDYPPTEYYDTYSEELQAKFQRVKWLVRNKFASGNYHEEILRNFLRNFFPKRLTVKTGFIYKNPQEVSLQLDIMVIDESIPKSYLFQEGDFAIVHPDCVIGVIEVKSYLGKKEFIGALKNVESAKKLYRFPQVLIGFVFGYDGPNPTDLVLGSWFSSDKLNSLNENALLGPSAIQFLQAGLMLTQFNDTGNPEPGGKYFHKVFRDRNQIEASHDRGWQLSFVIGYFIAAAIRVDNQRTHTISTNPVNLINGEAGMRSNDRFAFREGHSVLASSS